MKRTILASLVFLMIGCGKKKDYSVPSLLDTLRSKNPAMRYYAARELGHFGKDAVPHLAEALKDADKRVRMEAAYALAEIGPDARSAIPALKEASKDKDEGVRKGAAYALKVLQDPKPKTQEGKKPTKSKKHRHRHKRDAGKPNSLLKNVLDRHGILSASQPVERA